MQHATVKSMKIVLENYKNYVNLLSEANSQFRGTEVPLEVPGSEDILKIVIRQFIVIFHCDKISYQFCFSFKNCEICVILCKFFGCETN